MLLVDPGMFLFLYHTPHLLTGHFIDVPDVQNESFTSFLHWMKYIFLLLTKTDSLTILHT